MTEDQINTLLDTQRKMADRLLRIRLMAESAVTLTGNGIMARDFREAFRKIADMAAGSDQP